ncbi:adenine deaminase, partial [candidate division WOR-3 bacterium]|nr:adenine deaminase [candidate division WOR-3 bacterium]
MNLLLINANIINVLNDEIYRSNIYIENGIIKGFEKRKNCKIVDLKGKYVSPGFIEGHIHLESTHVLPVHLYKYFLKNGVTTVINDPHEIANAGGLKGIEFFMKQSEDLPVDFLFMIPSCVPASKFETTIHKIGIKEMK